MFHIVTRKIGELKWGAPSKDGIFRLLKRSIRKHGVLMPLIADKELRVLDGRKRAAAVDELLSEGAPRFLEYVPVIVVERNPEEVAREVDLFKKPLSIEELWEVRNGEPVPEKVLDREEVLISELMRVRGIGPRILRELLKSVVVVLPSPEDSSEEEETREALGEAVEYLKRSGVEEWVESA